VDVSKATWSLNVSILSSHDFTNKAKPKKKKKKKKKKRKRCKKEKKKSSYDKFTIACYAAKFATCMIDVD